MSNENTAMDQATDDDHAKDLAQLNTRIAQRIEREPEQISRFRSNKKHFEARLFARWNDALDLYDTALTASQEAATLFHNQYRPQAIAQKDVLFEVVERLQARACLTASEVRALLISGHAQGAAARWRTLHEVLVYMVLMEKHGTSLAARYLDYDVVQVKRNLVEYHKYRPLWDQPLLPEGTIVDDLNQITEEVQQMVGEHGIGFSYINGWAAEVLERRDKKGNISFVQLEKAAGLEQMRPYYNVASNPVHANVKGFGNPRYFVIGPSPYGLAAPAHSSIVALVECTSIMLRLRPTLEAQSIMGELAHMVQTAKDVYVRLSQEEQAHENS